MAKRLLRNGVAGCVFVLICVGFGGCYRTLVYSGLYLTQPNPRPATLYRGEVASFKRDAEGQFKVSGGDSPIVVTSDALSYYGTVYIGTIELANAGSDMIGFVNETLTVAARRKDKTYSVRPDSHKFSDWEQGYHLTVERLTAPTQYSSATVSDTNRLFPLLPGHRYELRFDMGKPDIPTRLDGAVVRFEVELGDGAVYLYEIPYAPATVSSE